MRAQLLLWLWMLQSHKRCFQVSPHILLCIVIRYLYAHPPMQDWVSVQSALVFIIQCWPRFSWLCVPSPHARLSKRPISSGFNYPVLTSFLLTVCSMLPTPTHARRGKRLVSSGFNYPVLTSFLLIVFAYPPSYPYHDCIVCSVCGIPALIKTVST